MHCIFLHKRMTSALNNCALACNQSSQKIDAAHSRVRTQGPCKLHNIFYLRLHDNQHHGSVVAVPNHAWTSILWNCLQAKLCLNNVVQRMEQINAAHLTARVRIATKLNFSASHEPMETNHNHVKVCRCPQRCWGCRRLRRCAAWENQSKARRRLRALAIIAPTIPKASLQRHSRTLEPNETTSGAPSRHFPGITCCARTARRLIILQRGAPAVHTMNNNLSMPRPAVIRCMRY